MDKTSMPLGLPSGRFRRRDFDSWAGVVLLSALRSCPLHPHPISARDGGTRRALGGVWAESRDGARGHEMIRIGRLQLDLSLLSDERQTMDRGH